MELHHSKHHRAYVDNLNAAVQQLSAAIEGQDVASQISLQEVVRFNGGGHLNHALFWESLTPASSAEAKMTSAPKLSARIAATWGSFETFQASFTAALLGIKGSGWGWLVSQASAEGPPGLRIVTTKDQDLPGTEADVPIFGVDMWEHAYYLQVKKPAAVMSVALHRTGADKPGSI